MTARHSPPATSAATAAVELADGKSVTGADATVNNTAIDVPSILLTPVEVTAANVADTVVADGFYTVDQICTAQYAKACAAANIQ